MGKKAWLSAVKKAVIPSYSKRSHKSNTKKSWQGNQKRLDTYLSQTEAALVNPPQSHHEKTDLKPPEAENEQQQIKQAYSIANAAAMAEEAAAAAADAAAEVIRLASTTTPFLGKSKEEIAAIKIQRAYRGYLARRGLQALRARRRLKLFIQGQAVKRQTTSTLTSMQTMARVQSQVRNRRIRMSEVNQALKRQLRQKLQKELDNVKPSEGTWDLSPKSKKQVDASLQKKKDAAKRREKALAYAHTRQQKWRNSLKPANPTSTDPNHPYWGWSWLERWNAVRPWEPGTTSNGQSVGDMGKWVSSRSPSKAPLSVVSGERLRSASSKGSMKDDSRSSTKSMKVRSRISAPGPSPLGSGKKGGPNTRLGVGSTKKQLLSSGSPKSRK